MASKKDTPLKAPKVEHAKAPIELWKLCEKRMREGKQKNEGPEKYRE